MKKIFLVIAVVFVFSILLSISWKVYGNPGKLQLDTMLYVGENNDSMYFVIDKNGDTVDWFMYWDGRKLDRDELNYLYSLPDSFRK